LADALAGGIREILAYPSLTCNNEVISRTVWPWPDIIITIARRNLTGCLAVLVTR
jgi:hypothetical protein